MLSPVPADTELVQRASSVRCTKNRQFLAQTAKTKSGWKSADFPVGYSGNCPISELILWWPHLPAVLRPPEPSAQDPGALCTYSRFGDWCRVGAGPHESATS